MRICEDDFKDTKASVPGFSTAKVSDFSVTVLCDWLYVVLNLNEKIDNESVMVTYYSPALNSWTKLVPKRKNMHSFKDLKS